jgi:hypothetical protein
MQAREGGDGKISLRVVNISIIGSEDPTVAYDSSFPSLTIRIDTQSSVIPQKPHPSPYFSSICFLLSFP